jgi:protein FAM50
MPVERPSKRSKTSTPTPGAAPKKKVAKNPTVDTSFLPDREREQQEREMRETLRQEWLKNQEVIKKEEVEVVYSYWDGSGHRKSVRVCLLGRNSDGG